MIQGAQNFYNCDCSGGIDFACVYRYNQFTLSEVCSLRRYACTRYIFGRNAAYDWILLTAYPSNNCDPYL